MTGEDARLVVVGSGPAGLEAVRAFRDHGGDGRLVLVTADADPPYDRPPLSKEFLRGEVEEGDLVMEDHPARIDAVSFPSRRSCGPSSRDTTVASSPPLPRRTGGGRRADAHQRAGSARRG